MNLSTRVTYIAGILFTFAVPAAAAAGKCGEQPSGGQLCTDGDAVWLCLPSGRGYQCSDWDGATWSTDCPECGPSERPTGAPTGLAVLFRHARELFAESPAGPRKIGEGVQVGTGLVMLLSDQEMVAVAA